MKIEIRTSAFLFGGTLFALIIGLGSRSAEMETYEQVNESRMTYSQARREERERAKQASEDSDMAIARYKLNCILIYEHDTMKELIFKDDVVTVDPATGGPLREGVYTCNGLGETAVVEADGTLGDIRRVATEHLSEFKHLHELLRQAQEGGR
jgi:hypothetical protein